MQVLRPGPDGPSPYCTSPGILRLEEYGSYEVIHVQQHKMMYRTGCGAGMDILICPQNCIWTLPLNLRWRTGTSVAQIVGGAREKPGGGGAAAMEGGPWRQLKTVAHRT